ncbi:MAG: serine hydrolase domain-containing protein [Bacteroidota bacterium]
MPQKSIQVCFVLIALTATFYFSGCHSVKSPDPFREQAEAHLARFVQQHPNIDAVSAAIVTPSGNLTLHAGSLLNGQPPHDETLYEIASITKTFTGLLLAHALVEGRIDLDDDIREHLPAAYAASVPEGITFRHLATHRSGLPLFFPHKEALFASPPNWDTLPFEINRLQAGLTKAQFFACLDEFELQVKPGESTLYSNAGTNLAGYLLESIYDQSFEQLLTNKLLEPLQMSHTTISLAKADKRLLAKGYNENRIKMPFRVEKQMNAEGGIISNVEDMMQYLIYHLNSDAAVVQQAHASLLNEPSIPYHQGLFWHHKKGKDGQEILYQLGGAYGASSWICILPALKKGVFLVTNTSGGAVHDQLEEVGWLMLGLERQEADGD